MAAGYIRATQVERVSNQSQSDRAPEPQSPSLKRSRLNSLFAPIPWTQEYKGLTGRMEALSPQFHWSFLVAKGVRVEAEEPVLSETHGLGEPPQAVGYLTTQARREHVRKHGSAGERCTRRN
jgi:hypothetical protein